MDMYWPLSYVSIRLLCLLLALLVRKNLVRIYIMSTNLSVEGFGRNISWKEDAATAPGYTMTFKEALHIVASDAFIKLAVPSWAMNKIERFRKVDTAFSELQVCTQSNFQSHY